MRSDDAGCCGSPFPPRRLTPWVLLLWLPLATPGFTQEALAPQGRNRIRQKYRAILDRDPYHDIAFQKTFQFSVEDGTSDALVEEFEALSREDPEDLGYRFILARLYQRKDRLVEAASILREAPRRNDRVLGLLGEIQQRRGELDLAAKTLQEAAAIAKDERSLRRLYHRIGALHLARKDRKEAAASLRKITEIDPESFYLRDEVARALADSGLHEDALSEYETLLRIAGEDASKRCSVLREMGRIHEAREEDGEALSCYRSAAALLQRGNWLKEDLEGRCIAVHRRRGTLGDLIDSARERVDSVLESPDPFLFLARILQETGDAAAAAETLREATERFPDDLPLGKRLIDALGQIGDPEGQVREYQRLIASNPGEVDLYLELGRVFARERKLEQAALQWERALSQNLRDANLCIRLARLYAESGMEEGAIRTFEQAIRIAPKEKSHPILLGRYLFSIGRGEEAKARWMTLKGMGPEADRDLAQTLLSHGFATEAGEVVEEALRGRPEDDALHLLHSRILLALGEDRLAREAARKAADLAAADHSREEAILEIVSLHESAGTLGDLIESEEAASRSSDSLVPALILAEAFSRTRQTGRAIDVYRTILEREPGRWDIAERLADLHVEGGDLDAALELYGRLAQVRAGKERTILEKIADIHLRRDDREKAFEVWRRMIRAQPDSPAVYAHVAKGYRGLSLMEEAIHHYRQALDRSPADPLELRMALADALTANRDPQGAAAELRAALADVRREADKWEIAGRLFEIYRRRGLLEEEIVALEKRFAGNPYDAETATLLLQFYLRRQDYDLAREMLDRVLLFHRTNTALHLLKAEMLIEMGEFEKAIETFEFARKIPGVDRDQILDALGRAHLEMGNPDRAADAWGALSDRRRTATLLHRHRMPERALPLYESLLRNSPDDRDLLLGKARVLTGLGKVAEAVPVYEALLSGDPRHAVALEELGDAWIDLGERDRAIECGRRLLGSGRKRSDDPRASDETGIHRAQEFFRKHKLLPEWAAVLEQETAQSPRNLAAHLALADVYDRDLKRPAKALEIYRGLMEAEWTSEDFIDAQRAMHARAYWQYPRFPGPRETIMQNMVNIYSRSPDLQNARQKEIEASDERTPEEFLELAMIFRNQGKEEEERAVLREAAAEYPEAQAFPALLAEAAERKGDHEEAARQYRALLDLLQDPEEMPEKAARRRRDWWKRRIPRDVVREATKPQVDEYLDAKLLEDRRSRRIDRWVPTVRSVLAGLAKAEYRLGHEEQGKAAIDAILRMGQDAPNLGFVGKVYFDAGLHDESEAFYRRSKETATRAQTSPIGRWSRAWSPGGLHSDSTKNLATIYRKKGEVARAWQILREGNCVKEAKKMLETPAVRDSLRDLLTRKTDETREAIEKATRAHRAAAIGDFLTNAVKLAEVLEADGNLDGVVLLYEEAIPHCGPVLASHFWNALSAIRERLGDVDGAIEAQRKIIAIKVDLAGRGGASRSSGVTPLLPEGPRGGAVYPGGYGGGVDTRENYYEVARMQAKKGEPEAGMRTLMRFFRMNPPTPQIGNGHLHQARKLAEENGIEDRILPLYRLVGMNKEKDPYWLLAYAEAAEKAGEIEEAVKHYEAVIAARSYPASREHVIQRAEDRLDELYPKLGGGKDPLQAILERVEGDPDNVTHRLRLARMYESEGRLEDAAKHLKVLREKSPYDPEVYRLGRVVARRLGDREGVIEALRKEILLSPDDRGKAPLHYMLGNLLDLEGREEEAVQAWMQIADPKERGSYDRLGNFFLELGMDDEADRVHRRGMEVERGRLWVSDPFSVRQQASP